MSGGFNPINMVSQAALAVATGGTSIVAQIAMQVATQIGAQVIQKLGQEMGLPQPLIDAAVGAFDLAAGNAAGASAAFGSAAQGAAAGIGGGANDTIEAFGNEVGASPAETGEAQSVADSINNMMFQGAKEAAENANGGSLKNVKGGGSLLMRIAIALGGLMDKKMEQMDKLTTQIGGMGTIDNKNQAKMGELTGKLQGLSQELNMLSNALTNSIKTIGEAGSTLARKG